MPCGMEQILYITAGGACTVSFDAQGGVSVAPQLVQIGGTVAQPVPPVKTGFCFGGWYTSAACGEGDAYDFDSHVTGSFTLYARWIAPDLTACLKLPAGLEKIEEDAFCSVAAKTVVIPASVKSIVGNPFCDSAVQYICGFPGTAAETFADRWDYPFIPVDDAWLASH